MEERSVIRNHLDESQTHPAGSPGDDLRTVAIPHTMCNYRVNHGDFCGHSEKNMCNYHRPV